MVDGINFNPFTGKAFTDEEISKLDLDKNGKISQDEFNKGVSWLSGVQEEDADAVLDESENLPENASKIFNKSKQDGIKDTAQNSSELTKYMDTVLDSILEEYMQNNPGLSAAEKSTMTAFIQSNSKSFLQKLLEKNPDGPYNMESITSDLAESVNEALDTRAKKLSNVNSQIENYKKQTDNFSGIASSAISASTDYTTTAEFNKIKSDAVKYLMGELLNGNTGSDFAKSVLGDKLDSQYYSKAVQSILSIANETDPDKIQEAISTANESLNKCLEQAGKDKLVNGFSETQQANAENELSTVLTKLGDSYIESYIAQNPSVSQSDIDELSSLVKSSAGKYLAELSEKNPDLTQIDTTNIVNNFGSYIDSQVAKLIQTRASIVTKSTQTTSAYDNLISTADRANSDKYISSDEKSALVKAGAEFILNQMLNGTSEIALLKAINSSYASNSDYKNVLKILNSIKTETDPDKLQELMKQATAAIEKMLDACTAEQLMKGINGIKPVEVTEQDRAEVMKNSSIASDYEAGASRTSDHYTKQTEEALQEVQAKAKQDLDAIAESFKSQLKSELGTAYDSATMEKYIQDAINDTLSQFSKNVIRRGGGDGGNYQANPDELAFVFIKRKKGKGRYAYNVQALANTFFKNFNETSKTKNAAKLDPSLATYDKENVIADSLGNDYDRNKTETIEGRNDDKAVYAQLIEQAKVQLRSVAASVKSSMLAEGVPLSSSEIDEILEDAITDTITDMKNAFQYCQPNGKVSGGRVAASVGAGVAGGAVAAGTAGAIIATAANYTALGGAAAGIGVATGTAGAMGSAIPGAVAAISAAGPIGWAAAGVIAVGGVLSKFTNIFGAKWGNHDSNAGFFFERKSNSHSGRWGYDTQTLVDTFFAKVDAKVQEAKDKESEKNNTLQTKAAQTKAVEDAKQAALEAEEAKKAAEDTV